jgi:hypothetical protein
MGACVWLAAGATGASQGVFRWPLRTQNLLKARILLNMASGELSERDGNHLVECQVTLVNCRCNCSGIRSSGAEKWLPTRWSAVTLSACPVRLHLGLGRALSLLFSALSRGL